MNLASPIMSVVPSGHGAVLLVLARTDQPLSGRRVAALTDGRLSPKGTLNVLHALVKSGLVLCEEQPPAKLYRLNRRHLAAEAVMSLAHLRARLIEALREHLAGWQPAPQGAWLFGSAARGDGGEDSDIDVLVVRPDAVPADDPAWWAQLDRLADDVRAWTGNPCSLHEHSASEFAALMDGPERLAEELRTDALRLAGELDLAPTRRSASQAS